MKEGKKVCKIKVCIVCGWCFERSSRGKVKTCSPVCSKENSRRITANWYSSKNGKMWVKYYKNLRIDSLLKCLKEAPIPLEVVRSFVGGRNTLYNALKLDVVEVVDGMVVLKKSPFLKALV